VEGSWEIDLFAAPGSPGWVVLGDGRGFWLINQNVRGEKAIIDKSGLTIGAIKSTIDLNLGNPQRLRRNAILELLVAKFPEGNSLTLPDPRTLPSGETGSRFSSSTFALQRNIV
jgi:hypothetical protein